MTEQEYKDLKKYVMKDFFWLKKSTFLYLLGGMFLTILIAIGFCVSMAWKIYNWEGIKKIEANIEKSNQLIQQVDSILQDVKNAPAKVEGLTDKLFKKKK